MSLPTVHVDVGFTSPTVAPDVFVVGDPVRGQVGVGKVGDDDIWTRLPAEFVRSWSIRRGANAGTQPTRRYEPGTATVVLNDPDRRFDPNNLDGPYVTAGVSEVQPMRRLRIVAEWGGVAYPLFYGFTDDWAPDYQGNFWTYVTVTATDGSKILDKGRPVAVAPVGSAELTGLRVDRILNSLGWPSADRLLDVGASTVQATTLDGNGMTELQLVQDTELGEIYLDTVGRVRFRDRRAVLEEERSTTSQVTFGDAGYARPVEYDFELGVAGFIGSSATITASTAQKYQGLQSLLLTVVGTPLQAYTRQQYGLPVTPGHQYRATFWAYHPTGGNVGASIDWNDDTGYLVTAFASTAVPAAEWTLCTVTGTAPAAATNAVFGPTLEPSPPTGLQIWVDLLRWEDDTPELPYLDVKTANPSDGMANTVTITRVGGTPQVAVDTVSVDRYLEQPFDRSDLIHMTDTEALAYADAILYRHADPGRRFSEISFQRPRVGLDDVMWPAILGRDFGDRITAVRRPFGGGDPIRQDCFVRGLQHSSDGERWDSAFVLENAAKYSFFTVGHPELGQVGVHPITY